MSSTTDLKNQAGIEKLKSLVKEIGVCIFCTQLRTNDGATCRPMSGHVDEEGNLWFFSARDSDKNREVAADKNVQLFFAHPGKNSYLVVNGEAEISFDRNRIEEFYSPLVKTWFKEGKGDPNISLIKVNTESAHYWDTDGNQMINFIKMLASVATGATLVTGKQGSITV